MKFFLALCIVVSLSGCGAPDNENDTNTDINDRTSSNNVNHNQNADNNTPVRNNSAANNATVNATPVPNSDSDCPPTDVFASMTCTSTMENAVCPGTMWCDDCEDNIATPCTCTAYELGFQYVCEDACTDCSVEDEEKEFPWEPTGACMVTDTALQQAIFCYETMAATENIADEVASCESFGEIAGFMGEWIFICPDTEDQGSCFDPNYGYRFWDYALKDDPATDRANCESDGGLWIP